MTTDILEKVPPVTHTTRRALTAILAAVVVAEKGQAVVAATAVAFLALFSCLGLAGF